MNDRQFQHMLDKIASQEIPDTMNIREAVENRLLQSDKPKRKRQPRTMRRWLMRIAAVLVVMVAGFALVYRLNQHETFVPESSFSGDNGFLRAASLRLLKQLNMTQKPTAEDISVNLKWGYADGNRIAVEYTVNFDEALVLPEVSTITLVDRDSGQTYPMLEHDTIGSGQANSRRYHGKTISFDARSITNNPANLHLRLTLDFSGELMQQRGRNSRTVAPFNTAFDFDVPFNPAVAIGSTMSSTASVSMERSSTPTDTVVMTLSGIVYAPSMTRARLCMTLPDTSDWQPGLTNLMADTPAMEAYFTPDPNDTPADERLCGSLVVVAMWNSQSDKFTIEIETLVKENDFSREAESSLRMALAQQGIEADIVYSPNENAGGGVYDWYGPLGVHVLKTPEGMSVLTVQDIINEAVGSLPVTSIYGPWRFEFATPPLQTR